MSSITSGRLDPLAARATKPLIEIGDSGFILQAGGEEGLRMLQALNDEGVRVDVLNGIPMISTRVKDQQGRVVVDVRNNRWEVSPDKAVVWDKNYTADKLEVKNGRDRVVLQVQVLPDRIRLQGEWYDDYGRGQRILAMPPPFLHGEHKSWFLVSERTPRQTEFIPCSCILARTIREKS